MTKVVTKDFKIHEVQQVIESVNEAANTLYFVCAMKDTPYADDANTPSFSETSQNVKHVYREILFAKKVIPDDVAAITRRVDWEANTAYAQFDDTDSDLSSKDFFVVSPESGSYHVFKCLDNNSNTHSTAQPTFSETSANDNIYQTADGYVWKYMYSITNSEMNKFGSNDYVPVLPNANVSGNAVSGAIDSYRIDTAGRYLNNYCNGQFSNTVIGGNTLVHRISSTSFSLSSNNNFYANTSIYLTSGRGAGQLRTIVEYIVDGANTDIVLDEPFETSPDSTTIFNVSPRLLITGDGQDANAIVTINTSANSISSISIINKGSNYSYANVSVLANTGVDNIPPSIRPIISPYNGHGSLVENELFATKFSFSVEFANNEANSISTDISFRRIGLLKDPLFASVELTLDTASTFLIGETVTQENTTAYGVVASASGNDLVLTDVYGFFSNNTADLITGETSLNTNFATNVTIHNYNNGLLENRDKYTVELTYAGVDGSGFQVGEQVTQNNATGYISEIILESGSTYSIYLTEVKGEFVSSSTIIGADSESIGEVTESAGPCLKKFSGEFLYIENLDPINRANNQTEKINIILGF